MVKILCVILAAWSWLLMYSSTKSLTVADYIIVYWARYCLLHLVWMASIHKAWPTSERHPKQATNYVRQFQIGSFYWFKEQTYI